MENSECFSTNFLRKHHYAEQNKKHLNVHWLLEQKEAFGSQNQIKRYQWQSLKKIVLPQLGRRTKNGDVKSKFVLILINWYWPLREVQVIFVNNVIVVLYGSMLEYTSFFNTPGWATKYGGSLRWDGVNRGPVLQPVWRDNDLSLLGVSAEQRLYCTLSVNHI